VPIKTILAVYVQIDSEMYLYVDNTRQHAHLTVLRRSVEQDLFFRLERVYMKDL
jgi:hypothetical protein